MTPTVRQPARWKAPVRVRRSLAIEVAVALLVVDPQAGQQRGVGQPADPARRRRGEEAAPGREPGRVRACGSRRRAPRRPAARTADPRPRRARSSRRRRRSTSLPRSAVSSWSPGVSRKASTAASAANACWSARPAGTLTRVVVGERGRARSRRPVPRDELRAEQGADHPDRREHRDGPGRRGRGAGPRPGSAAAPRAARATSTAAASTTAADRGARSRCLSRRSPARKVVRGAQQDPVEHRVERSGEHREEADVEELHDGQHAEQQRRRPPQPAAAPGPAGRAARRRRRAPRPGCARTRRA